MAKDEMPRCEVDGQNIRIQIYKGTGVCSELCRKVRAGALTKEQAEQIRSGQQVDR